MPRAFYVKCRPDADIIDLVHDKKRVFIGYPPQRRGVQPDPHHMRAWILDISASGGAWDRTQVDASGSYMRQISMNSGFASSVNKGDLVVVPRPGNGRCLLGRISGRFELVDDPVWADEAVSAWGRNIVTNEDRARFLGDYVQSWPVEAWADVAFTQFPRWIAYRLLSRNTIGWIEDRPDGGKTATSALEEILAGVQPTMDLSTDKATVRGRLLDWVSPAAFEHLACDLLQLEQPNRRWWHVGGSGDGGVDGLGADTQGRVVAALQCKWKYSGDLTDLATELVQQLPPTASEAWVATLYDNAPPSCPPGATIWGRDKIAELVIKHAKSLPLAITLRVG